MRRRTSARRRVASCWNDASDKQSGDAMKTNGMIHDVAAWMLWLMAKTPTTPLCRRQVKSVVERRALTWSAVNSVHPSTAAAAPAASTVISRHRGRQRVNTYRPLTWRLNIWNEIATTRPTWTQLLDRVMSPLHASPFSGLACRRRELKLFRGFPVSFMSFCLS